MQVSELSFLVVEDNDFQRHWLKVMLNNVGATNVFQASNGNEALRILKDNKNAIDISFIDLNLPGMDGMELIRHMSKQERSPSIVLASALAPSLIFSVETMSKAYGVNLLGSIEKPAMPDTILNLIGLHKTLPRAATDQHAPRIALADILEGLAKKEFQPFFQPKVELGSGKVKGIEAFARWHHPQLGLLYPASFLPALLESQEIAQLDLLMFEKVLNTYQNLQRHDPSLEVSMNISASWV